MKHDELKQLGSQKTTYEDKNPHLGILETFQNTAHKILIPFICNEFTSLCPKTGQPDFAKVEILYIPDDLCIESKSLKLYLFAFRNHGDFHEDCMNKIADDIVEKIHPKYLRVFGDFQVRGGISIKPLILRTNGHLTADDEVLITHLVPSYDRLRHWDYQV